MLHWVFKIMPDKDKSRIVLNGKEQDPDTYGNVYSPTAQMTAFRILMAKAAERKWELFSDDASQAAAAFSGHHRAIYQVNL